MEKNKIFLLALSYAFIFVSTIWAQNSSVQPLKVGSKIDLSNEELKPVEYSKNNYVLLKKMNGDISEFYVSELGTGTDSTMIEKKEKLFSLHKNDRAEFIQFSGSGDQVVFRKVKNEKKIWKVYDISTGEEKIIESNEGSVNTASIYSSDQYLYITSSQTERHKVYLQIDNNTPLFIGNGISVLWSPNGNYFLVKSPLDKSLSLREKKKFGKITKDEYRKQLKLQGGPKREIFRRYMIYNTAGERLLTLQDYDLVQWIQWSPDSKKIVLKERSDRGFKIVYLNNISENVVEIAKVYHFQGLPPQQQGVYTYCEEPSWSPDGKRLLFISSVEDGHKVLYNNIYILEDGTYQYFPVIESKNEFVYNTEWISEKSILVEGQDKNTKINQTYELIIE